MMEILKLNQYNSPNLMHLRTIFFAGKEPTLDGLRAIAILLVVFTHIFQTVPGLSMVWGKVEWVTPLFNGWMGVDLFFVLSGFLVGGQILRAIAEDKFSFINFYIRRIFRIVPAYYFVILIVALTWRLLPSARPFLGVNDINARALSKNLLFLTDYFPANLGLGSWSLSIEEQFYLLIPVCLVMLSKYARKNMLMFFMGIIVLSLIIRMLTYRYFDIVSGVPTEVLFRYIYFPLHTRMDALSAGVCIYILFKSESGKVVFPAVSSYLRFIGGLFISFVLLTGALSGGWFETTLQYTLVAVGFSLLLLGILNDKDCLMARFLASYFWAPIARISYSVYLTHIIVIHVIQHAFGGQVNPLLSVVVMLFASFLVSLPLYFLVESPLHRFAQHRF